MHLKRIELEGFKSFADRTVIPVEDGLTGIVGPNGCGKSNVVDALLWVMGERSAKALRADSMDDVIFRGKGRPSAPYAMVEVILGDPDGTTVEPGGEVAVGRRLFSSGDSEYLLHGRKVRRKDVREVLLDTGLGVQGYMVLAQGKIDAVLDANPEERRSVFEEAAGISRYKTRKHETKLKLKAVERDLSKVDTVLDEVSRTVRSLRLQAGKAKRFIELRDQYRDLRIRFALDDSTNWHSEAAELRQTLTEVNEELDSLSDQRQKNEAHFSELEAELNALRERNQSLRSESGQVKEQIAALEERVAGLQTRAAEADTQVEKDNSRLEVLVAEQERDGDVNADLLAEKSQLDERLEQSAARLDEMQSKFAEVQAARNQERDSVEQLRGEILEALQQRSIWNNKVAEAAKKRSESDGGLGAIERRHAEIVEELSESETALSATQENLSAKQQLFSDCESELAIAKENQEQLSDQRLGFGNVAHEKAQARAAAEARVEAYGVIDEEMPGVPEHLRSFLESKANNINSWVLDKVTIASPWDSILENMLGRMQHAFWCNDNHQLPSQLPGGVYDFFSPVSDFKSPDSIEGATPLYQLLEGDDDVRQALCTRLGNVYCVDELSQANDLASKHADALFIVASGEIVTAGYSRRGVNSEDAAGVLARRNGKQAAEATLLEAVAEFEAAKKMEDDCALKLSQAQSAYEKLREKFGTIRDDLQQVVADERQLSQRHLSLREEHQALDNQHRELKNNLASAGAVEAEAVEKRDECERHRLQLLEVLAQKEEGLKTLDSDCEQVSANVQDFRIEKTQSDQDLKLWTARHSELASRAERQQAERTALQTELQSLSGRGEDLRQQAEEARAKRSELLQRRAELSERCEQAESHVDRGAQALNSARSQASGESQRYDALVDQRHKVDLELQKLDLQSQEMARAINDEFGQSIDSMVNSLGIDRDSIFEDGQDLDAAREKMADSRRRIEKIGSVNLDAVNELEERAERESFLISERDDLLAAKTNLEQTLEDLDVQCRGRFVETFDKVKVEFESIFRRLFNGGKARLELEADVDPLDAGIDISVRPPGKDLRSINLLSGGERTLTALALLLAVFQSRPSPFCLLDEVDAALDDSNVDRFVNVLQDFVGSTQFLVVTHNRITMSRCQRLFGVTMRKRGESMVVSVDLDQIKDEGEIDLSNSSEVNAEVDLNRPSVMVNEN
ncbi:MAG: chromosome segregation protein SMC [Planctomycetota bacterium]|nr:chromosome segregation protein SMC [Planctomycetota bacterium]